MLINIRTNLNIDKLRAAIRAYKNTPKFSYDNTYLIMNEGAAKELGIDDSEVNKCLKGKRNTSHGYSFVYLTE